MQPIFVDEAEAEFVEAHNWYNEREPGLGGRFAAMVKSAIDDLMHDPTSWPVVENEIRRKRVQVFPYDILFAVEQDEVVIVAVMDHRRRPGYWKSRIKK